MNCLNGAYLASSPWISIVEGKKNDQSNLAIQTLGTMKRAFEPWNLSFKMIVNDKSDLSQIFDIDLDLGEC